MSIPNDPDFTRIRPARVRVRLPVSAADAFAYVSNPCNDPKWVDTTPRVTQTDGDGPVIGASYEYEQTVLKHVTGTITITDVAAPSFMAFRVEDPMRIYRVEYRITAKGNGCVLEQSSYPWFKNPKLQRRRFLARFLIRKQLQKQMRALRNAITAE